MIVVSPLKVVTILILILIRRLVLSILVDIVQLFSMLLLKDYIKKVLERFNMHNAKLVHVPLHGHLKLSKNTMSRE